MRTTVAVIVLTLVILGLLWAGDPGGDTTTTEPATADSSDAAVQSAPAARTPDPSTTANGKSIARDNVSAVDAAPLNGGVANVGSLMADPDREGLMVDEQTVQDIGAALDPDFEGLTVSDQEPRDIGTHLDPDSSQFRVSAEPPRDIGPHIDPNDRTLQSSDTAAANIGDQTLDPDSP